MSNLLHVPCQGVVYCLTSLAGTYAATDTSAYVVLAPADAYAALPDASHIFLLEPRQRNRHLDVANQDAGKVTDFRGHRQTLYYLPGIMSLIITCIGIITK